MASCERLGSGGRIMKIGPVHRAGALLACVWLASSVPASAASVRNGFTETLIASGLGTPTAMAFAPDGRLFVAQQGGALRVIKDGSLLPTPFLTVLVNSSGERGLLGVAFHPNFPTAPYVYIYYTATSPNIHNRISRFTANGDVAVAGSEVPLLDLPTLSATNHNGGAIHFGPDGMLYAGVGENAVSSNSQSLSNPLGKILRIGADGSIPASNPFFGQTTGNARAIWALGLRNPFTFAFELSTGRMLINDVGGDAWEEINEGRVGANYGWPNTEGPTSNPNFVEPIYAYTHDSGCAISGGAFYPSLPSQYPASYQGDYFFADFCSGWIRQYDFASGLIAEDFASGITAPVDLLVGPEGSLYYLARGSAGNTGTVVRIDFSSGPDTGGGNRPPVPTIALPAFGALYTAGGRVGYAGSASDPEDGTIPPSRFSWEIVFHHGTQTRPLLGPITGVSRGSFTVPNVGETATNVWYRIRLTVTDSAGQQASTFRDVTPRTAQVTLAASATGLTLTLDGQPVIAPFTFTSVVGMRRSIGAVSPQTLNGVTYGFRAWSDRRAQTHTITTPTRSTTIVAGYRRRNGDETR